MNALWQDFSIYELMILIYLPTYLALVGIFFFDAFVFILGGVDFVRLVWFGLV